MDLLEGLEAFFTFDAAPGPRASSPQPHPGVREGRGQASLCRGDRVVVAFSGSGDSTALLWGLSRLAPAWGIEIVAAHLDHAMDPGSRARAALAGKLARRLDVPLVAARREIGARRRAGESPEAAARRVRYEFLEEVRRGCRARYVATAHHREDQAETVLLRLRFGSGLRGLAGIRPLAGAVVRPLLALPRAALRAAVAAAGLRPAEDPGNGDPRQPRSRMRHRVLPALARADAACGPAPGAGGGTEPAEACAPAGPAAAVAAVEAELVEGLARLAARTLRSLAVVDRRLADEIGLRALPGQSSRSAAGSAPRFPETASCTVHHPHLARGRDGAAIAGGGGHPGRGRPGDPGESSRAGAETRRLASLPPPLLPHALALLHRQAGAALPASQAAVGELRRQLQPAAAAPGGEAALVPERLEHPERLERPEDLLRPECLECLERPEHLLHPERPERPGRPEHLVHPGRPERPGHPEHLAHSERPERPGRPEHPERSGVARSARLREPRRVACDCGQGWRWHGSSYLLYLERKPRAEEVPPFTYTLEVPGKLTIPELAVTVEVGEAPVEVWMLRGAPHRAALALPLAAGGCLTVRNRRPGDRLRPLGSPGSRKLKEVLIDRGVPKERRDRLPLLCWAGEIAWVPGVTIGHRFRLTGQATVWVAEVTD
jgi:tRNA(Ile)-lysidine synthetase-like protein